MKKGLIITTVLAVGIGLFFLAQNVSACSSCFVGSKSKATPVNSVSITQKLSRVTIPIEGMTCGGCSAAIKSRLKSLEGMADCKVSHKTAQAICEYDSKKLSIQDIKDTINKTGYKAL